MSPGPGPGPGFAAAANSPIAVLLGKTFPGKCTYFWTCTLENKTYLMMFFKHRLFMAFPASRTYLASTAMKFYSWFCPQHSQITGLNQKSLK